MKKTVLRNDFHGTRTTIIPDEKGDISRATYARIKRELCGCTGCCCGITRPVTHYFDVDTRPGGRVRVIEEE